MHAQAAAKKENILPSVCWNHKEAIIGFFFKKTVVTFIVTV